MLEEMAMRASLLFFAGLAVAILSIAAANAQPRTVLDEKKPLPEWRTSFSACVAIATKQGWNHNEVSWFCGVQAFPREANKGTKK
jgi:hypothetical protein